MMYFATFFGLFLIVFLFLVLERYCGLFGRLYYQLTGKSWYKD